MAEQKFKSIERTIILDKRIPAIVLSILWGIASIASMAYVAYIAEDWKRILGGIVFTFFSLLVAVFFMQSSQTEMLDAKE